MRTATWRVFGALVLGFTMTCGAAPNEVGPPNLLVVIPDQFRGQALGVLGQEPVKTPHLDAFAAQAVVFTQAVSNWPVCSPFRGQFMTGQYPTTNGVIANCSPRTAPYHVELKPSARCWSDVLHDRGYSLGYIGKWHLEAPHAPPVTPAQKWNEWVPPAHRHGFDFWYAYNDYDVHLHPVYWTTDAPRDGFTRVEEWGPQHEAEVAIQYLDNAGGKYRDARKPFALVVAMNPPHSPYIQVPERYRKLYADVPIEKLVNGRPDIPPAGTKWGDFYRKNIRDYYAAITGVDEQFGRIATELDKLHLTANTIVVFASDHGDCLGIHDEPSKSNPYEEAMRIPLMIRWPGHLEPRRDDLMLSVPDFYPTLLGMMGFADDIPTQVQGVSYARQLETGTGDRPGVQLYFHFNAINPATGDRGVRTARYTFVIQHRRGGPPETLLFDRQTDPYEMHNIAAERPEVVHHLRDDVLLPGLRRIHDPWAASQ